MKNSKDSRTANMGTGMILFFMAVIPTLLVSAIVKGYVLKMLWTWFIVPVFHLPALTISQAIGISVLAFMSTSQSVAPPQKKEQLENKGEPQGIEEGVSRFKKSGIAMANLIIAPFAALGVGWIVHFFV